ncbi:protein saal1 isoform X2 [Electrophorus electricus]|uniref:Protein SAAL1 n=1 Tax=Electrophorus electricus TaxID=8005 RepID=A0A4W4FJ11_ELEEL|nr:protein saal1 isoform X2 [Electrophorus electricus]
MDRNENFAEEADDNRSSRSSSPPDSPNSPEMDRNPSPPPEGDDETAEEADAIGETVYSKHWLFSTLTRLIQMVTEHESHQGDSLEELSEEQENELCKVWDMAMDKDVAGFLQEFKAPDILLGVITKSHSPRLTEICVGILGNMACFHETCVSLSQNADLGAVLLLLLGDNDPPTLLETCRLLLTCVSQPDVAPLWLERIQQQTATCSNLCFIMRSSTNVELLMKVGELVDKLLDEDEELMKSWLSRLPSESHQDKNTHQDITVSLLEAAVQIRKEGPEALEAYMHALQLLTTVDEGLQHLVSDGGSGMPLWTFVCEVVCEDLCQPDDPPLILQEQKALLAPALALLSALHTSLQIDISLSLVGSLLRILYFYAENQRNCWDRVSEQRQTGENRRDEAERDIQTQAVVEIAGELLSAVLTCMPRDAVSDLMKDDHLTDKIWVAALKNLLPEYITAVQCFLSTLEKVEPNLAGILKQECSIPSEPVTTKLD